jgi:hypothetical protein
VSGLLLHINSTRCGILFVLGTKNTQSLLSTSKDAAIRKNAYTDPITLQENLLTEIRTNLCARSCGFLNFVSDKALPCSTSICCFQKALFRKIAVPKLNNTRDGMQHSCPRASRGKLTKKLDYTNTDRDNYLLRSADGHSEKNLFCPDLPS